MRQIILDTETTGLHPAQGERVAEICALEVIDYEFTGKKFHTYLQPEKAMPEGAFKIHGLSDTFLADKPRFADVAMDFLEFIREAQLVIHNAPFDIGFLDNELRLFAGKTKSLIDVSIDKYCTTLCTAQMARNKFPGERASLDALCQKFGIDNTKRGLHSALLDCELLLQVYLKLKG